MENIIIMCNPPCLAVENSKQTGGMARFRMCNPVVGLMFKPNPGGLRLLPALTEREEPEHQRHSRHTHSFLGSLALP